MEIYIYKLILLGSGGFIGRNLASEFRVNNVDFVEFNEKFNSKNLDNYVGKLQEFINHNISTNPVIVINCMGVSENNIIHSNPKLFYHESVMHQKAHNMVLESDDRILAYIMLSTGKVYASTRKIITEDTHTEPVTVLGKTKLAVEVSLKADLSNTSTKLIICRLFNIYGPDQRPTFLIPYLISSFLNSNPEIPIGNLEHIRSFLYIKDLVRALIHIVNNIMSFSSCEIFNIGGSPSVSVGQIINILSLLTQTNKKTVVYNNRLRIEESEIERCDSSKLNDLGWKQDYKMSEGLYKCLVLSTKR